MKRINTLIVVGLFAFMGAKPEAREANAGMNASASTISVQTKNSSDLVMFVKDGILTVSCLNKEGKSLTLSIIDETGIPLFSNVSKEAGIFHQRLLLSSLPSGKYYATLTTGGEKYECEFKID